MTKYILNSGGIRRQPILKKKFHQEMVVGTGKKPHILICSFAQGREYWEAKFPGACSSINEDLPNDIEPTYELAMPAIFEQQCKRAWRLTCQVHTTLFI